MLNKGLSLTLSEGEGTKENNWNLSKMNKQGLKIVFMGTPDFAVPSLDILLKNDCNVVGVITVPDKPAGRGLELHQSAVKKYALEKGLKILQPEKLKDETFLNQLKELKADLQVVVAFRMLPEVVWKMPRLGTFNLHASLLPQYRGAAPINWAIINGEKETGATTFFLQHEIDTGKIIFREKVNIGENETAGELHNQLMNTGANLVLKTVQVIESGNAEQTDQSAFVKKGEELKTAPKIFKESCKINWTKTADEIHNLIRGLSPYPSAFTELKSIEGKMFPVKIFEIKKEAITHSHLPGKILTDSKHFIKVAATGGLIDVLELQLAGKKRMRVEEFLRGFPLSNEWKFSF